MQDHRFIKSKDFPRACRECEYGKKYHIVDTNTKTDSKPSDQQECHFPWCKIVEHDKNGQHKTTTLKPSSSSSEPTQKVERIEKLEKYLKRLKKDKYKEGDAWVEDVAIYLGGAILEINNKLDSLLPKER